MPLLQATITGTSTADGVVYFDITVTRGNSSHQVARRYSEFDSLRKQLLKDGIDVADFPRKHLFRSNTDAEMAERKIKLSGFINSCVLCNDQNPECRAFLDLNRIWWVAVPASAAPAPDHTITFNTPDVNGNGTLSLSLSTCDTVYLTIVCVSSLMSANDKMTVNPDATATVMLSIDRP